MFHHSAETATSRAIRFHWYLLSFLAGCINAGGYLACHRFVSHVTGFATLFGVDIANGRMDSAIGILSVPAYFLLGVVISAYFVDRRLYEGKNPRYVFIMTLIVICIMLVAVGGTHDWFGSFGEDVRLKRDYFLLALLCMASGLQNAVITSASGHTVRTTHLTGITTDLGIGLVRVLTPGYPSQKRSRERQANIVRVGTILAFGLGSSVSAIFFLKHGYYGFYLPAVIAFYTLVVAYLEERRYRAGQM